MNVLLLLFFLMLLFLKVLTRDTSSRSDFQSDLTDAVEFVDRMTGASDGFCKDGYPCVTSVSKHGVSNAEYLGVYCVIPFKLLVISCVLGH